MYALCNQVKSLCAQIFISYFCKNTEDTLAFWDMQYAMTISGPLAVKWYPRVSYYLLTEALLIIPLHFLKTIISTVISTLNFNDIGYFVFHVHIRQCSTCISGPGLFHLTRSSFRFSHDVIYNFLSWKFSENVFLMCDPSCQM